jgi:hypothetical protein
MADVNAIGRWSLVFASLLGAIGCSSSADSGVSGGGSSMDEMAAQVDEQAAAQQKEEARAAAEKKAQEEAAAKAAAKAPPERKVVGRPSVAPGGGYFSAIIGARRHILNEADSWAWKQGVASFRATNGRKPKDNAEFMKRVIAELEIPLPPKEEDEEYFYDPAGESDGDYGQLYVVEKPPATNNAPAPSNGPAAK